MVSCTFSICVFATRFFSEWLRFIRMIISDGNKYSTFCASGQWWDEEAGIKCSPQEYDVHRLHIKIAIESNEEKKKLTYAVCLDWIIILIYGVISNIEHNSRMKSSTNVICRMAWHGITSPSPVNQDDLANCQPNAETCFVIHVYARKPHWHGTSFQQYLDDDNDVAVSLTTDKYISRTYTIYTYATHPFLKRLLFEFPPST